MNEMIHRLKALRQNFERLDVTIASLEVDGSDKEIPTRMRALRMQRTRLQRQIEALTAAIEEGEAA